MGSFQPPVQGSGPAVRLAAQHSSPHIWHRHGCKADPSRARVSRLGKPGTHSSQPRCSSHPCLPRAARLRYPSDRTGPGCAATGWPAQQVPHPNLPAELQQRMPEGGLARLRLHAFPKRYRLTFAVGW